ncbi:MAG: trk system potassium uptake protein TrkA, partial [Porticoccaceae bacterium]
MSKRIVICGAGEVGTHIAELLAGSENSVTVIDVSPDRIAWLDDAVDISTVTGSCTNAEILRVAIGDGADLLVACTDQDEVNLLTCALAKHFNVKRTVARVEHRVFFESAGLDYAKCLGIDGMICPDYSTALAISRLIRNPGAVAIEDFGQEAVEMQELNVSPNAPAVGQTLATLQMPPRTLLAAVRREDSAFVPSAATAIQAGDNIVLVGHSESLPAARRLFFEAEETPRQIVIMSGSPIAVWLCRNLPRRRFRVRLFEPDRARAAELGDKLDWVTVIQADVLDPAVFEEEKIGQADILVACGDDDEQNMLTCVWAKNKGTRTVIAVSGRSDYLTLLAQIGIDYAVSPRNEAAEEIDNFLDHSPLQRISTLAEGVLDVYRARVGPGSKMLGRSLAETERSSEWIIALVRRDGSTFVPEATDVLTPGDTLVVVGAHGIQSQL